MLSADSNTKSERVVFAAVGMCFLLSGFAALLFQTAWMRQLSTVFGTSELAVATILASYMGGLAFGALLAARFVRRIRRPILVYGVLELAIAVSAIAVPYLLELAAVIYTSVLGGQAEPPDASGVGQSLFYLVTTFVVLAVPTACMGATLPMLTRYAVRSDRETGPRVGLLYAINTFGAVAGTLVAAFLLLPSLGLMGTIVTGACVNLVIFGIAAVIAKNIDGPTTDETSVSTVAAQRRWSRQSWILPIMMISGATTFAYEVLWTRLLSQVLGGSVIAFATMLASFLSGIAIGSALAARLAVTQKTAQFSFVIAQVGIALVSLGVFVSLGRLAPDNAGLFENISFAVLVLLPATLFIGATFPLAVRILSVGFDDAAQSAARVYAWNTMGAIVGAVFAGFVLIPQLRYEGALHVAVAVNLLLALVAAIVIPPRRTVLAAGSGILFLSAALLLRVPIPEALLRISPLNHDRSGEIAFYDVGRSATVVVLEQDGYFNLRTNGLPEASTDMRGAPPSKHSQRLLAAVPVLARPDARKMLIIGFGGGVVAENIPESITNVDIVELEPKVIEANRKISPERNVNPFDDPRISIVINDARSALRLTDKRYDIIVSQPSHPWTAGASHLYTQQFMELARQRLLKDGIFLQWMNTRLVSEQLLRSLVATLRNVFPHVRAYQFDPNVIFFLASEGKLDVEHQMIATGEPLASQGNAFLRKGIGSVNDVVAALAWDDAGLQKLSAATPIITDDNNLMALQSAGSQLELGMTFARLKELIAAHGPLYTGDREFYAELQGAVDFAYISDRLIKTHSQDLAEALASALLAADHPQKLLTSAKISRSLGRYQEADQILLAALNENPSDPIASYLILSDRRTDFSNNSLPAKLREFGKNLTPSAANVLRVWSAAKAGDQQPSRLADLALASVRADNQWYLDAAKLRSDWRINAAKNGESSKLAEEAMDIIDNAIAVHQDLDFYGMRMAAAFLAEDYNATFETARRMVWYMQSELRFLRQSGDAVISVNSVVGQVRRLQSIKAGMAAVRDGGHIGEIRLGRLDAQIDALIGELQDLSKGSGTSFN